MKKSIVTFLLFLLSPFCFAKVHILTCEPEWAALANTLAGDYVDIYSATSAMQDPHTIQARPSLIAHARKADLLICSGAELEIGWLPLLLQKSGNPNIQPKTLGYFMTSNYVPLLEKGGQADRSAGDIHLAGNPHIHTSPYNVLKVADALVPVLTQLLPEHAEQIKKNHAAFTAKMQQSLATWQPILDQLHGKKIVVYHDYWVYLSAWANLEKVASLEPKPGVPPTTTHLTELLGQMKREPANLIIFANYHDKKPAQWLSSRTGIPSVELPSSVYEWEKPDALIQWYDQLLHLIQAHAS